MQTIGEAREHCRFVGKGIETPVSTAPPRWRLSQLMLRAG